MRLRRGAFRQRGNIPLRDELLRRERTTLYSCLFWHTTTLPEDRLSRVTANVTKWRGRMDFREAPKAELLRTP